MLWALLASLFAGRALSQVTCAESGGKTQSGSNNFIIDQFTGLYFSFAIGQCTAYSLLDTSAYVKYTCNQEGDAWTVTKQTYTDAECTVVGEDPVVIDSSTSAGPGQQYYFKCDGDNTYGKIKVSTDSSCQGPLTVYGALGVCSKNAADSYDTKFYCDETSALLELYETNEGTEYEMCDDDNLFCVSWVFGTSGCSLSGIFGEQQIFGYMETCAASGMTTTAAGTTAGATTTAGDTTAGATTTGVDTTSSAKSQFTVLGAIVALAVGLFH